LIRTFIEALIAMWVRVTTRLPLSATSIIYYGNIPFAVLLSVLVLREPLTARTMSGALLIIGGSVWGLVMKARRTTSVSSVPLW
jgi:drug/metabolite transporter (DMT)-like permease